MNSSRKILDTDRYAESMNRQIERILDKGSINQVPVTDERCQFIVQEKPNGGISTLPSRSAEMNQNKYLEGYGVYIDLPSMYVMDAQLNSRFPDYLFQLVKVVFPNEENYSVTTSYLDGTAFKSSFRDIERKYKKGLALRLIKREKSQLIKVRELVLDGIWSAFMKFSECGNHFALIIPYD
jgi:hypothetical protein